MMALAASTGMRPPWQQNFIRLSLPRSSRFSSISHFDRRDRYFASVGSTCRLLTLDRKLALRERDGSRAVAACGHLRGTYSISPASRINSTGMALSKSGNCSRSGLSRSTQQLSAASRYLRCDGWKTVNFFLPCRLQSQASVYQMSTWSFETVPLGPMNSHVKGGRVLAGNFLNASVKYSSVSKHCLSSGKSSVKSQTRK
mmetsp:Transcript_26699/g.44779  ORF Transcript_26699/g.44779 Transcript_26699/m.44779 type:complete len:200 (-) Transcript_26699:612-1211(-)